MIFAYLHWIVWIKIISMFLLFLIICYCIRIFKIKYCDRMFDIFFGFLGGLLNYLKSSSSLGVYVSLIILNSYIFELFIKYIISNICWQIPIYCTIFNWCPTFKDVAILRLIVPFINWIIDNNINRLQCNICSQIEDLISIIIIIISQEDTKVIFLLQICLNSLCL